MTFNDILLLSFGGLLIIALLLYVFYKLEERRLASTKKGQEEVYFHQLTSIMKRKSKRKERRLFLQLYYAFTKTPILRSYTEKVRSRISNIHAYDHNTMITQTVKIVLSTCATILGIILLSLLFGNNLSFVVLVLIGAAVFHHSIIDVFVLKIEHRLLHQTAHLLSETRHFFQQTKMIESAIYEAAQTSSHEALLHGNRIYEILNSTNPEEELEKYYEGNANRFLKSFAGISFLVKEFGDRTNENGSVYLDNINKLIHEIHIEILRKERLRYYLRSLTTIALAPILFTRPIELWAKYSFPLMEQFYDGKLGILTKVFVFVVALLTYLFIKRIQDGNQKEGKGQSEQRRWEKKLYSYSLVKWVVDHTIPATYSKEYKKVKRLLTEIGNPVTLETFYFRRIVTGLSVVLLSCSLFFYMHIHSVDQILHQVTTMNAMVKPTAEEEVKIEKMRSFDQKVIMMYKQDQTKTIKQIVLDQSDFDQRQADEAVVRIQSKWDRLQKEHLQWWEVMVSIVLGWVAYQVPYYLYLVQRRMRRMAMQHEVEQFHAIIAILSQIERVSVENILEWMERFAVVFEKPIQKCLLHYEAGAEKALSELMDEVSFIPFVRIIERLQLACEQITVKEAFDDLEVERIYYHEQRKQNNEKTLEQKVSWGRFIAFVPAAALIFLYLIIPMLYLSITNMSVYLKSIQP